MPEFHKGSFNDFVSLLAHRMQRDDRDNMIAIDGYEGTGKSAFALQLARAIAWKLGEDDLPIEHVLFDWSQWDEAFSFSRKRQIYVLDEGGNLALSRDAMSGGNKELLRILTQARQLNDTLIFCMPSFFWLDKYVREHRVSWWIHVEKRGEAIVLERAGNWRKGDTWFEECGSVFRYGDLAKADPSYWHRYLKRKKEAFLDRFDPAATKANVVPEEPYEKVVFHLDNALGTLGRKRRRSRPKEN